MNTYIKATEYCESVFDGTHDTPKPTEKGMPLVTSKHIMQGELVLKDAYNISLKDYTEINKRSKISQWDILFSMIGTVGNTYIEKSNNINYAIKNIGVFSCKDEKKAKFLYYYLQSPYAKRFISSYLNGAVQKFLPLGKLREFPILPYTDDKNNIVDLLSSIDEKIEINNKINTELENMAKTLYDYWFVQFDFPDENKRPYKSANGKMVYNEVLKREIPVGWEVGTLCDICKITRGVSYDKKVVSDVYLNGFTPIFRANNIDNGHINYDSLVFVPNDLISNSQIIRKNDVIMTMSSGSLNHLGKTYKSKTDMNYSYGAFCSKITPSNNYRHYLSSFLSSLSFQIYIKNMCLGTNINNLNNEHIYSAPICIPNTSLLDRFNSITDTIFSMIGKNEQENVELVEIRDFLLPLLMNGQVTVSSER